MYSQVSVCSQGARVGISRTMSFLGVAGCLWYKVPSIRRAVAMSIMSGLGVGHVRGWICPVGWVCRGGEYPLALGLGPVLC